METLDLAAIDGFAFTATIQHDSDHGAPWENEDGHGEVTDWTTRAKLPGELVLCENGRSKRFYDFAGACAIAMRDCWGESAYRLDIETGANGLKRANGQWFTGRELCSYVSLWFDDVNDAIADIYAQRRASYPSARAYAAAAARSDFDRLRGWCNDSWHYVGVVVTCSRNGVELGSASLWGIESDARDYLQEVAHDLRDEALEEARATLANLCECDA